MKITIVHNSVTGATDYSSAQPSRWYQGQFFCWIFSVKGLVLWELVACFRKKNKYVFILNDVMIINFIYDLNDLFKCSNFACFLCLVLVIISVTYSPQGSTESCNTNEEEDMKGRKGTQAFSPLFSMPPALWPHHDECCIDKGTLSPRQAVP